MASIPTITVPLPAPMTGPALVPIADKEMDRQVRDIVATSLADMSKQNIEAFTSYFSNFWDQPERDRLAFYERNPPLPDIDPMTGVVVGFLPSPLGLDGAPVPPQWSVLAVEFPSECERMVKDFIRLMKKYNGGLSG